MEKYPSLVQIIISLSVMIALLLLSAIQAKSAVESYNSVIALKVTDLSNEQFDQLSQAFDEKQEAHIDYVCQQSGIIVVKLTDSSLKDKGDIHTYLKSIFTRAAKIKNIEILHIYTEASSGGQC